MKEDRKLTLPFVNDGKPFKVSNWTLGKHEEALAAMAESEGELSESQADAMFRYYVVYIGLKEIDDSVKLDDVKLLHPENMLELFKLIYYAGRVDIFFRG